MSLTSLVLWSLLSCLVGKTDFLLFIDIFLNLRIKAEPCCWGDIILPETSTLGFSGHFELLKVDAQICYFFVFLRVRVGDLEFLCLLVKYLLHGIGRRLLIEVLKVTLRLCFVLQTL